jgi:hypothetical protein
MTARLLLLLPAFALALGATACGDDDATVDATNDTSDDVGDAAPIDADGDIGGDTTADAADSADSADDAEGSDSGPPPVYVNATGIAWAFALPGEEYGRISGEIHVLENPEIRATSDAEGSFVIDGLEVGSQATFVIVAEGFPEGQTKTFTVPEGGIEELTFQIPPESLTILMARLIEVELDDAACQIVSTFTRVGKSIGDAGPHGEPGATVTIEPALEAVHGPIYFNEDVLPDRSVLESSEDGGVVFVNVPPGTYTLTAHKEGVEFEQVTVECRAGVLVNASPPYGLQALAP